ncbi:MAG: hypothetical protein AAGH64_01920 [Planctomycetota bacterium]
MAEQERTPETAPEPADPQQQAPPTEDSKPGGEQKAPPQQGQFRARPASVSDKPRRVRAGRKLKPEDWPARLGWAGSRWVEAIRAHVPEDVWRVGLDYAERGQTRRLETVVGGANADVQGRPYRPYTTELLMRPFPHEKWDEATRVLVQSSIHAAKLLAGEMPETIQDEVFASLGLDLFPHDASDIRCVCNCRETGAWCKHGVCVAVLLAEDIDADPFLLFRMRGLEGEDLLEKLRQRRELENVGTNKHASALRLPFPGDETPAPAMESVVDEFWDAPKGIDEIETTPRKPEVAHALLRRLGPTPFEGAKFPLSGLLATCYDTFTREALGENTPAPTEGDDDAPAPKASDESKGPQLSAAARLLRAKVAGKKGAKASAKARKPSEG